jgi:hypothetical protein
LQTSVDLHHTSILNSKQFVHLLKNHITSSWCANEVPVCKIAGIQSLVLASPPQASECGTCTQNCLQ